MTRSNQPNPCAGAGLSPLEIALLFVLLVLIVLTVMTVLHRAARPAAPVPAPAGMNVEAPTDTEREPAPDGARVRPESGGGAAAAGGGTNPVASPGQTAAGNPSAPAPGIGASVFGQAAAGASNGSAGAKGQAEATNAPAGDKLLSLSDVTEALARIAAMPWGPEAEKQLATVLRRWAELDPTAALNYTLALDSRRVRSSLMAELIGHWARQDPAGARAWFMQNLAVDPKSFESSVRPLYQALANTGVEAALNTIWELPTAGLRSAALKTVADQLARQGAMDPMLAYFQSLTERSAQTLFASALMQSWAIYHPDEAVAWAAKLTDPQVRDSAVNSAVLVWAYDNPAAAANWVMQLPDDPANRTQLNKVTQMWARENPVAVADWILARSPPNARLDPAIQGLVTASLRSQPESAMRWATALTDTNLRDRLMEQAARAWLRQDPLKAAAYIVQSPLPVKIQQQLLNPAPRN